MRLAFMGTPDFAVPVLSELIAAEHEIVCVYTQPPRPKGRGLAQEKSPVHRVAETANLPVRTPATLRNGDEQIAFVSLNLDAAVVVAYGLILPKPVLQAPRLGCFNLHASLLPRWRGAAPIQRAIMACDSETGVMMMRMDEGLDTGPVLTTERVAIGRKTYGELHDELRKLGAALMCRGLAALENGSAREEPQPEKGATYAKKIESAETRIDWSLPAAKLDCIIRGLSPKPGGWFEHRNERIRLLYAKPVNGAGAPGEFLVNGAIACGEGALLPVQVQRAGRSATDWVSFLRGFQVQSGERFA